MISYDDVRIIPHTWNVGKLAGQYFDTYSGNLLHSKTYSVNFLQVYQEKTSWLIVKVHVFLSHDRRDPIMQNKTKQNFDIHVFQHTPEPRNTHILSVCHTGQRLAYHTVLLSPCCCCRRRCCSGVDGTLQLLSLLSAPPCLLVLYLQYLVQVNQGKTNSTS